jgi:hypothetical protein
MTEELVDRETERVGDGGQQARRRVRGLRFVIRDHAIRDPDLFGESALRVAGFLAQPR